MFEYGPDGKRRLTRFGQRIVAVAFIVGMVLAATVYLVAHRQSGENAGAIITGGFALAGTLGMGILTWGQGRRNEDILHYQNEKLEQIHGQVEVREEQTAAVVRETYQAAMTALVSQHQHETASLREELQRERHKLMGRCGVLEGANAGLEKENSALRETKASLEAQVRELTDKLARVAERGAGDGKGKGEENC